MSSIPGQDFSAERMAGAADFGQPVDGGGLGPDQISAPVDLEEAGRQLELAAHDIAVASTCLGLGDLNEAHINAITARAAADAAEEILRIAVGAGGPTGPAGPFS